MELGFDRTADHALWHYAREEGFSILTKDTDFEQLSLLRGAPPKVIWLRIGNCTTRQVLALLNSHHADIAVFHEDTERSLLALGPK
jgi:predicted nuclease of predicted toxin-antitoxin system